MARTDTPMTMMAANTTCSPGGGGTLPLPSEEDKYLSEPNIYELGQLSMLLFII